jgi:hypothetical protein
MPRGRGRQTKAAEETIKDPHHILLDEAKEDVAQLIVKTSHLGAAETVGKYEPFVTMDEIKRSLADKPGKYIIIGVNHAGERLRSWAELEVEETEQVIGKSHTSMDTVTNEQILLRQQLEMLAEERRLLAEQRMKWEDEQKRRERELEQKREQTQSEHVSVIMQFLERERESERKMRAREEERMREFEQHRQELEAAREEREAQRQLEIERERQKIEQDRERIAAERAKALEEEYAKKLQHIQHMHELQLEAVKTSEQQRTEFNEQIRAMKLEQEKRALRDEYKNDLPEDIIAKIWDRRIDKEYPEETGVERLFKQFAPLLEIVQNQMMAQQSQPSIGPVQRPVGRLPGEDQAKAIMGAPLPYSEREEREEEPEGPKVPVIAPSVHPPSGGHTSPLSRSLDIDYVDIPEDSAPEQPSELQQSDHFDMNETADSEGVFDLDEV